MYVMTTVMVIVLNGNDAFPDDDTETPDTDNDGVGNNADTDDDNDVSIRMLMKHNVPLTH